MNNYELPTSVEICGKEYRIRNKCEHRVILDVIDALNDTKESQNFNLHCAMRIFFENCDDLPDPLYAFSEEEQEICSECANIINEIINCGKKAEKDHKDDGKKIMDWKHDYPIIAPPVSRVLGYSVRDKNNYTHWYDYIGAMKEVGDCYWTNILSIRSKLNDGKKLENNEIEFYKNNIDDIKFDTEISIDEEEWLNNDW